ncbi:MAG: hypothetical protein ABIO55_07905 [Ginsengibacter sp.]
MVSKIKYFLFLLVPFYFLNSIKAQGNLYTSYTTVERRAKLYDNLIKTSIHKNLSLPLNDSTEENWQEAFSALELLEYRSPLVDNKITSAFDSNDYRSIYFQKALMELVYANYEKNFAEQATHLLNTTFDQKTFAISAEYILRLAHDSMICNFILDLMKNKFSTDYAANPVLIMLQEQVENYRYASSAAIDKSLLIDLLNKNFLPGEIVMYSVQRKNRNYPGLVFVRNKDGVFIKDSVGKIFNVPQLARSVNNLPCYLSNGNTPQGIFKMKGFGVSRSYFIGPTPNIQLSMPVEETVSTFLNDSSITDTAWAIGYYSRLLPHSLKNYQPLYQCYYAASAGRTEIIAHGTTINPDYYKTKSWYPHTPSQGCLCTKEIWNGKRIESDQQKLVYALLSAGGAHGYCVVIEIDDKQAPVAIEEILPLLVKATSVK